MGNSREGWMTPVIRPYDRCQEHRASCRLPMEDEASGCVIFPMEDEASGCVIFLRMLTLRTIWPEAEQL